MPTPAERKALLFLAGVIVLGTSVRLVRGARGGEHADDATRAALARQLAAVDSAHGSGVRAGKGKAKGNARSRKRPPRGAGRDTAHTSHTSQPAATAATYSAAAIVDIDVADALAMETLPHIGPVLARRIVEDRAANGPFGSLDGFQRVRGVGPALARALQGRVTFSGTARPSNAVVGPRLSTSSASSKSRRRERRN